MDTFDTMDVHCVHFIVFISTIILDTIIALPFLNQFVLLVSFSEHNGRPLSARCEQWTHWKPLHNERPYDVHWASVVSDGRIENNGHNVFIVSNGSLMRPLCLLCLLFPVDLHYVYCVQCVYWTQWTFNGRPSVMYIGRCKMDVHCGHLTWPPTNTDPTNCSAMIGGNKIGTIDIHFVHWICPLCQV